MKNLSEIWFWFTLLFCPIGILVGIFQLASLSGFWLYSDTAISMHELLKSGQLVMILVGFTCACVFADTLKKAKIRFRRKYN
ncbi:hypothetical protein [Psychrosphaera aestuarii]|uniref:hypothetical protein n=1 Tax=Psychrosphaera aestuarii TaxID=1266052 RepID=UPI001B3303D6|nr:hypothetical protein [Psychrosphaera aestuarii]